MFWGYFISCMFGELYLNSGGFIPLFIYFYFARGKQSHSKQIATQGQIGIQTIVVLQANCSMGYYKLGAITGNGPKCIFSLKPMEFRVQQQFLSLKDLEVSIL